MTVRTQIWLTAAAIGTVMLGVAYWTRKKVVYATKEITFDADNTKIVPGTLLGQLNESSEFPDTIGTLYNKFAILPFATEWPKDSVEIKYEWIF